MELKRPSLLFSTLRTFLLSMFGVIGALVGLVLTTLLIVGLSSSSEEGKSFPHHVKILPDAEGHRKSLSCSTPVVLTLFVDGVIGEDPITSEKVEEILLDSQEDSLKKDRVKAVLLVINSPGGGVSESGTIYRLLQEYKKKHNIPVFAYVDGLCASGGYYIACAADRILASPTSLIGSVGVISWPPFFNVSSLLEKWGIQSMTLSAGKGKDALNPTRPWTDTEGKQRQAILDYFYQDFVSHVTSHRPQITPELLTQMYGAEVFPTRVAMEYGFIDGEAYLRRDALRALVEQAGIEGEYQVVCFKTKSWWKEMMSEQTSLSFMKQRLLSLGMTPQYR